MHHSGQLLFSKIFRITRNNFCDCTGRFSIWPDIGHFAGLERNFPISSGAIGPFYLIPILLHFQHALHGWDLWRVSHLWKQKFTEEMVARGHDWFGEARGNLIQHIGQNSIAQSHLDTKAAMTKQAVQQHLDDLVKDGVVERIQGPNDARKKLVRLTAFGCEVHEDGNRIKRQIDEEFTCIIGKKAMKNLKQSLAILVENEN